MVANQELNHEDAYAVFFFVFIYNSCLGLTSQSINLARAKSEALFNVYSFLKENIKSSSTKDEVKTTRTVKNNNNRSN